MASNENTLTTYRAKRNFDVTTEPSPEASAAPLEGQRFMIHKHDATRLHYDLRFEHDGVLGEAKDGQKTGARNGKEKPPAAPRRRARTRSAHGASR